MNRNGRWQPRDSEQAEARRQAILDALASGPNSTRQLANVTEIPMGCLVHHVGVLTKRGLVRHERAGNKLYFARTDRNWSVPMAFAAHDPGVLDVVRLVGTQRLTQKAVLDAMPWPRATTQNRLRRAVDQGLLTVAWSGRYCMYTGSEAIIAGAMA